LSPDAERRLHAVPEVIGAGEDDADRPGAAATIGSDEIAGLIPEIQFDQADVEDVLEEAFGWMAKKFESDHWKLTDRQSRMLGRPTTQLLTSLWSKVGAFLPEMLARWCETTPGLAGFILAGGIVVGPKVAHQFALSRSRREKTPVRAVGSMQANRPGPIPVAPHRSVDGPVGVASTGPVVPLDEADAHSFFSE
jgi:hypothetical protein